MHRVSGACAALAALGASLFSATAWSAAPLLLRNPTLSQDRIAFLYADDIWMVPRQGGEAHRFTSVGDVVDGPYFSPDGTQLAYSTSDHGLTDGLRDRRRWRSAAPPDLGTHGQPTSMAICRS